MKRNKELKIFLLIAFMSFPIYAENMFDNLFEINASCTSSSGLSIYDISLNSEINSYGEIRYRFAEQDVFYTARVVKKENNILMGIAEFLESRTGDTSGRSWVFTYDIEKKILTDNESIKAKCK